MHGRLVPDLEECQRLGQWGGVPLALVPVAATRVACSEIWSAARACLRQ